LKFFTKFFAGAKGANFYDGGGRTGDRGRFGDGVAFHVEQGENGAVSWRKSFEEFGGKFAGGALLVSGLLFFLIEDAIEGTGLVLGEVGPTEFGPGFLAANLVQAGVDRDAGDPVLERGITMILFDFLKHFNKNNLCQIFRIHTAGQMAVNNPHYERIELTEQFAGRFWIIIFNALQPCARENLFSHSCHGSFRPHPSRPAQ